MMPARGQMSKAVADSLRDASIADRDRAGVQLIRRYAQLLDEARDTDDEVEVYSELGPKMLAALTALGLTLAGRAAKGGGPDGDSRKLDELRRRREQRSG